MPNNLTLCGITLRYDGIMTSRGHGLTSSAEVGGCTILCTYLSLPNPPSVYLNPGTTCIICQAQQTWVNIKINNAILSYLLLEMNTFDPHSWSSYFSEMVHLLEEADRQYGVGC